MGRPMSMPEEKGMSQNSQTAMLNLWNQCLARSLYSSSTPAAQMAWLAMSARPTAPVIR